MPDLHQTAAGSTPVPDPTLLTTEQLTRGLVAERDYVNGQLDVLRERLNGIDTATDLRINEIAREHEEVPKLIEAKVGHLAALTDERFASIATQFLERDTRSERESRDNKVAVDAAFAAQKEAAAKQDESNAKAIDKSEAATTETINKLGELFTSSNKALSDKIDDLKARVQAIESHTAGGLDARTALFTILGLLATVAIIATHFIK